MISPEILPEGSYSALLEGLEKSIFPHICDTEGTKGQSREPVFYQIEHGKGHLNRVRRNMEIILQHAKAVPNPSHELGDADIFVALAAASFHDLGMHFGWSIVYPEIKEPPTEEQSEKIRKHHGFISAQWFRQATSPEPPYQLKLAPDLLDILKDPRLNERLAFTIEAHQMPIQMLETELQKRFPDESELQRISFLACLLKLADTLDMDSRRVSRQRMQGAAAYLLGQPSEIRPKIEDIVRFLMAHYLWRCELRLVNSGAGLEFKPDPRVPSQMLDNEVYRPLREYLLHRYRERLRPTQSYVEEILRNYAGISWQSIIVPDFKDEASQFLLPRELLPLILNAIRWERVEPMILPGLPVDDWVRSKRPLLARGASQIFPVWEEFEADRVYQSPKVTEKVESILADHNAVLVVGRGACGKSVFGIGFARKWMKDTEGIAIWLDLREHSEVSEDKLMEIVEGFVRLEGQDKLFLVDNAHLNDRFINDLLDRVASKHWSWKGKLVLLARPRGEPAYKEGRNIYERMTGQTIELVADADTLKGVANRLLARFGRVPPWTQGDYEVWVDEFGGDLMAFAHAAGAVISMHSDRPSRRGAMQYVRERYLDEADRCAQGREPFLRLCALANLDLPCPDQVLGCTFAEYQKFYQEGLAISEDKRGFRYWQFIHPRLAEMILETAANDKGIGLDGMRISYLLEASRQYPFLVLSIGFRLAGGQYTTESEFHRWKEIVQKDKNLIDRTFAINPFWWQLEKFDIFPRIDKFKQGELRFILIVNLRRTMPEFLVKFFHSFEELAGEEHAQELLKAVLNQDAYLPTLRRAAPPVLCQFLHYLEDCNEKEHAQDLLKAVLKDDSLVSAMRHSMPYDFMHYLSRIDHVRANELLTEALEDNSFILSSGSDRLIYVMQQVERIQDRVNKLPTEAAVIEDTFLFALHSLKLNDFRFFLDYLVIRYDENIAKNLLDKIFNSLTNEEFKKKLGSWPRKQLNQLHVNIKHTKLWLPKEIWGSVIKMVVGEEHRDPCPDLDYPQDKLLDMSVPDLVTLLKANEGYKLQCIKESLISDISKLIIWLNNINKEDATLIRDTIDKINLRIPEAPWEILVSRCKANPEAT